MFWILAILIFYAIYRPKEMIFIVSVIAFFGFGFWMCSFISSEPVLTFSVSVFVIWILTLLIGLTSKTTEEDKKEK